MKLISKIKYPLLKLIDISGFKVFDPPVRLLYGEEPQKQVRDILKFMMLPIVFLFCCVVIWNIMGPNHKTKSGEVPTPFKVLEAAKDSYRFHTNEGAKENAFLTEGADKEKEIKAHEEQIAILEEEFKILEQNSKDATTSAKLVVDENLAPFNKKYEQLNAEFKEAKSARKAGLVTLAEKVAAKEAAVEELITAVKTDKETSLVEKEQLKDVKVDIDKVLANPPKEVKEAQLAANKVADEIQHLKKLIYFLSTANRETKEKSFIDKAEKAKEALALSTTGKDTLKNAKLVVSNESKAEKTKEQSHPKSATIIWQTYRSLATVFVGFIIAAAIAIPVGIMCGLNRIVMACLTPVISIFRPVSPVVWLLIFQIIVGAFFPDPEKHPLFLFMNSSNNPVSFLDTNPAMIFSACTVAMCALWPALVNTALGVSAIDKDHLNVAKVLRLGFWSRLFKIIIPSSLPLVFAGLRISLGVGWMVLIAAEALSSSDGLGKFVWDEYQNGSSQSFANIILACFVVGIIGFFLDRLMIILQRLVSFDDGSATA